MWETFSVECGGGLVTDLAPIQQGVKAPGSARYLVNFEESINGGYRRINGYTKWDSTAVTGTGTVLGVGFFDGNVVAVRDQYVVHSTGSGWTTIASGRTQTTKNRFILFNFSGTRKILGVDGSNYPYTWDKTTFTNVNGSADVLGASHATDFKDHMFYAKGNLVTYSVPFDETDFTVADGAGNFRVDNTVTGLHVFRERLFIFTTTSIWVLDGTSTADWALSSVTTDIGCTEPDTIQEVGTDVMFMGPDGLRLLGATDKLGDFSNAVVSKSIQSDINSFASTYTSFSSVVVRNKSQYRVLGYLEGRDSINTRGFIGAATLRGAETHSLQGQFSWSISRGIKAYSADSRVYNGTEYVVFTDGTDYVFRMESGKNFDGTAIPANYWTPYLSINDPSLRKTFYTLRTFSSPEGDISGTVSLSFDQNNANKIQPAAIDISASGGGSLFGSGVYGTATYQDPPTAEIRVQTIGSGFNVSYQYSFTGDTEPFIIDTLLVEYATNTRR